MLYPIFLWATLTTVIGNILHFTFITKGNIKKSGASIAHLGFGLILFSILIEPLDFVLGIPLSFLSRKAEYAADAFSAKYVDKKHMISALHVLIKENFSNLNPHPLYILLHYSHPAASDRLGALEKL